MNELPRVTCEASSLLTNIPGGTFEECRELEELNLPDSLTTIADTAFVKSTLGSLNDAYCAESLLICCGTVLRCFGSPSMTIISSNVWAIGER
jgi:hypothetical protein